HSRSGAFRLDTATHIATSLSLSTQSVVGRHAGLCVVGPVPCKGRKRNKIWHGRVHVALGLGYNCLCIAEIGVGISGTGSRMRRIGYHPENGPCPIAAIAQVRERTRRVAPEMRHRARRGAGWQLAFTILPGLCPGVTEKDRIGSIKR